MMTAPNSIAGPTGGVALHDASEVRCVVDAGAALGESPVWDVARQCLWWVDIHGRRLHRFDPATGRATATPTGVAVTAIAVTANDRLLAATDRGIGFIAPGGGFTPWLGLGERAGNRHNDGKVDPAGRFWIGTMDAAEVVASGAFYRIGGEGGVTRVGADLMIANGPAFDRTGRVYFTDSGVRTIYQRQVDDDAAPPAMFASFEAGQGTPDGMTCDAEDHLWVAFWDGGCLRRLSPDGRIVAEWTMPVRRPTSCAFGGAGLDLLFVTSAAYGLDGDQLQAGGLFMFRPGVDGVAPTRFVQRPPA